MSTEKGKPIEITEEFANILDNAENKNTAFDRCILRDLGLPEDYQPRDAAEEYRLVVAWLED